MLNTETKAWLRGLDPTDLGHLSAPIFDVFLLNETFHVLGAGSSAICNWSIYVKCSVPTKKASLLNLICATEYVPCEGCIVSVGNQNYPGFASNVFTASTVSKIIDLFQISIFLQKVKNDSPKLEVFSTRWFQMLDHYQTLDYILHSYKRAHETNSKITNFALEKTTTHFYAKLSALLEENRVDFSDPKQQITLCNIAVRNIGIPYSASASELYADGLELIPKNFFNMGLSMPTNDLIDAAAAFPLEIKGETSFYAAPSFLVQSFFKLSRDRFANSKLPSLGLLKESDTAEVFEVAAQLFNDGLKTNALSAARLLLDRQ